MKQLGNLAIVCANRPEILMQIFDGRVSIHLGAGPERMSWSAAWTDDLAISEMIHELNFGSFAAKGGQANDKKPFSTEKSVASRCTA